MGFTKAFEMFFAGSILLVILFTFLSTVVPLAQGTIDNAPAGAFAMAEASKLMLGLIGFVVAAGFLYAGVRELLKDEGNRGVPQFPPGGYYG